jgi:hypothetical protein
VRLPAPPPTTPPAPFIAYRVALDNDANRRDLAAFLPIHPAFGTLLGGRRGLTLAPANAEALYEATARAVRDNDVAFPLRFTPVRCARGRALPFEAVALSAPEILHLVHEGFFGPARGREAAIAAVRACGALPVPALGLPPIGRDVGRAAGERYVDALIEGEARLRKLANADLGG